MSCDESNATSREHHVACFRYGRVSEFQCYTASVFLCEVVCELLFVLRLIFFCTICQSIATNIDPLTDLILDDLLGEEVDRLNSLEAESQVSHITTAYQQQIQQIQTLCEQYEQQQERVRHRWRLDADVQERHHREMVSE